MVTKNTGFGSVVKLTDRSVAASCLLGLSIQGTDLTGVPAVRPASAVSLAGLPVRERNERPTEAPVEAAVAQAHAYAFAAAGAGSRKQTTQHHTMWAFRGLEPWSDPA